MSLQDKTISGMFWSFLQKVGASGVSFIVMILLARLLTPKDFGLIGMLSIFIMVSQTVVDGGFNLALIQKKDTDEEDYSSVFYINLAVSILLYLVLYVSAPFIANFYHQDQLTLLTRVLALVFIINAFSYVQEARLTKNLRFKILMLVHIPSTILGGIGSIVMALSGFGVWSIVALQLITRLAYAVQIWVYAKWKPLFSFNKERAKYLFSFGGKLLVSRVITALYNNIFLVVIGKFYPVSSVGYYQNAFNVANAPSSTITSVLSGVTFPVFSSIQDDDKRLKEGYKKVMQQAFFWICPAYVLAAILAKPLFELLFTSKWLPAVPYFQWLCISAILQPLSTYNLNIINVKGRSDVFLKLQSIRRIITIVTIILVFPLGIKALLITQALSEVFTYLLFGFYSGRFISYSLKEQISDILPILLLTIVIGLCILFFINTHVIEVLPNLIKVVIALLAGGSSYILVAKIFKFDSYLVIERICRNKIAKSI